MSSCFFVALFDLLHLIQTHLLFPQPTCSFDLTAFGVTQFNRLNSHAIISGQMRLRPMFQHRATSVKVLFYFFTCHPLHPLSSEAWQIQPSSFMAQIGIMWSFFLDIRQLLHISFFYQPLDVSFSNRCGYNHQIKPRIDAVQYLTAEVCNFWCCLKYFLLSKLIMQRYCNLLADSCEMCTKQH